MLKYERIAKENKISVTYKDRTSLFTKDFTFALGVAIALHLSFLFLFNVKDIGLLFHLRPSALHFNVESDPIQHQISLDAESQEHGEILPEPEYEGVMFLGMPAFTIDKHFDELLLHSNSLSHFLSLEEHFPPTLHVPPMQKVEVHLFHEMAGREILNKSVLAEFEKIKEKGYAKFHVQVDDELGKVIWAELTHPSGSRILDQKAKQLLHALTFDRMAGSFVTLGEVEIQFHD